MAGKRLTWIFELLDRVSSPAKAGAGALEKVAAATEKTGEASKRAERHTESFQTRLENTLRLGERAIHVAEAIGEIGKSAAEAAVEAASFKETTLLSLTTVFGNADRAQKVLKDTVGLAARLPITTEDAINATTRLALAGFDDKMLQPLVTAAADVKALNQGRTEAMEAFLRQLTDIKSVGLSDRHLMYLSMETHLPEDKILANISQLTGLKGTEKQIKQFISKGMVDRDTAINAVLRTLQQVEGGQIGGLSNKLAGTVSGLMSTLKSRKLELLMDLDASPGYAKFRTFLGNLTTLLDPTSPFGKKVSAKIATTFNAAFGTLFGDFSGPDGLFNMSNMLDKLLHGAELVGVAFRAGAGFVKGFGDELLSALGIGGNLFGPDGSLNAAKVQQIVDKFTLLGQELADVAVKVGAIIDKVAGVTGTVASNQANPSKFYRVPLPMLGPGVTAEIDPAHPFSNFGLGLFHGDNWKERLGLAGVQAPVNAAVGGNISRAGARFGGTNNGGDQNITVNVSANGVSREDAGYIGQTSAEGVKKAAAFLNYGMAGS